MLEFVACNEVNVEIHSHFLVNSSWESLLLHEALLMRREKPETRVKPVEDALTFRARCLCFYVR